MLIRPEDCPGGEMPATGPELYKGCFKVEKLRLMPGFEQIDGDVSILFKLMNLPEIVQPGKKARDGYTFGLGKYILFPAIPGCKAELEMSLRNKRKIVGSVLVYLDEVLKCLVPGTSEIINCSVVLANSNRKRVAVANLKLTIGRIGPQETKEVRPTTEGVKAKVPEDKRNKIVFKTKEQNPKFQVELSAPRGRQKPIIPPYHEDVAVQTVGVKLKKRKGKKELRKKDPHSKT